MKYVVLAVRDRAADVFGQPHFAVHVGSSIRGFGDEINRAAPDNAFNKHPEDFDLYELGTFDDATGVFECHTPRQVAVGKDLVRRDA